MAEGDLARLVVTLEASTKAYERALAKAQGTTVSALRRIEKESQASASKIDSALASAAGGTGLSRLIGNLGGIGKTLATIGIGAGIAGLVSTLARLGDVADDSAKIGITAEQLQVLQFAAAGAGTSAQEMTRALLYLNKEIGESGDKSSKLAQVFKLNGESLRNADGSLKPYLENLTALARIVANASNDQDAAALASIGFGKAGASLVPVLRDIAGGLGESERKAREFGAVVGNDLVSKADDLGDALSRASKSAGNALASLVLKYTDLIGVLDGVAKGAAAAADRLEDVGKRSNIPALQEDLAKVYSDIERLKGEQEAVAKTPFSELITSGFKSRSDAVDQVSRQLDAARDKADQLLSRITELQGRPGAPKPAAAGAPPAPAPPPLPTGKPAVVPTSAPKGDGNALDAYERESAALQKRIELLAAEAATIGKTTAEREKAKAIVELTTAAQERNRKEGEVDRALTAEETADIERKAAAYGVAMQNVEDLTKAHDRLKAALDDVRSTAGSTLGAFANDLAEGTKLADALKTAMDSVRTAILNALANQFVTALLGPTGTIGQGLVGSIFGGGRAGGGAVAPGREYRVGENGPERFVPTTRGRIEPIAPVRAAGGTTVIRQGDISITAMNSSGPELAALRRDVVGLRADLTRQAGAAAAQKRGTRT